MAQPSQPHHHPHRAHRPVNNKLVQYGVASFYSGRFNGHRMSDGELFDDQKLTAAHNSLPLGTFVKITNRSNGKWVIVKITDRLHYTNRRLADLSLAAAKALGFRKRGLARIKLEVIPPQLIRFAGVTQDELAAY